MLAGGCTGVDQAGAAESHEEDRDLGGVGWPATAAHVQADPQRRTVMKQVDEPDPAVWPAQIRRGCGMREQRLPRLCSHQSSPGQFPRTLSVVPLHGFEGAAARWVFQVILLKSATCG